MKKSLVIFCSLLLVFLLSACGQSNEPPIDDNSTQPTATITLDIKEQQDKPSSEHKDAATDDTKTESNASPKDDTTNNNAVSSDNKTLSESQQALSDFRKELLADGNLCGVAYLGYSSDDFAAFFSWLEKATFLTEYPFLAELTEENSVLGAGEEWYAVIPADDTFSITVNEVVLDETDATLKNGETLLQSQNGSPILLRGNISDIMPNLMVTITRGSETLLEYSPSLSLKDGYLASAEGVYDFTNYDSFMEAADTNTFVTPIALYKANTTTKYEKNDVLLSSGNRITLRLSEEDASRYPIFAEDLVKYSEEALDDLESNVQLRKEQAESDERSDYYSNNYVTIPRADEHVISIRSNFEDYIGGIHPDSYLTTYNFDPDNGGWYALEDIISDTSMLLSIIEDKLFEKYPAETFFAEKGCIFENYTTEELNWTLDYQGITFYFSPYNIAPYSEGTLTVTIWFDEIPRLFYDEYTYAPKEGHAISFYSNEEIEFDRNLSDNRRDVLFISHNAAIAEGANTITILYNGGAYTETEFEFDELNPYLVCTGKPGNANYYLYLELLKDSERTLCIYQLDADTLSRTEAIYNVTFDSFQLIEKGIEVVYKKLLAPPLKY